MKTKYILYAGLYIISISLLSSQLYATGLGIYGTASRGSSTWKYHKEGISDFNRDADISKLGFGFVLDTAVAMDNLFNYRLNVGYGKVNIDTKASGSDIEGKNYHLFNTFGFGVLRSELIRLWLGPQIGVGFIRGEYDSIPSSAKNKYDTFYFSVGLVTGINFNIGEFVTIGIDGGYRINRHVGSANWGTSSSFGITGTEKEIFANLSFLFRINDIFE